MQNLEIAAVLPFAQQVDYREGEVVKKALAQGQAVRLMLAAFDAGTEIATHTTKGDALVIALEGQGKVTIDGQEQIVKQGEAIVMPANHPHSVAAHQGRFKMFLVVEFLPES